MNTIKDKKQVAGFFITKETKDKLKELAEADKRTISQFLTNLVEQTYSKKFKTKV